jgi:uncharacterized protein
MPRQRADRQPSVAHAGTVQSPVTGESSGCGQSGRIRPAKTIYDMHMNTLSELLVFLAGPQHLVRLLETVDAAGLPNGWIGAGVIRTMVWNELHGLDPDAIPGGDVDVIYLDRRDCKASRDIGIEMQLHKTMSGISWSVHNQARMHVRNGDPPYVDIEDAIAHWPETCTAIAARWNGGSIDLLAPYGVDDLLDLVVRPTPAFARKMDIYRARSAEKNWQARWPKLNLLES